MNSRIQSREAQRGPASEDRGEFIARGTRIVPGRYSAATAIIMQQLYQYDIHNSRLEQGRQGSRIYGCSHHPSEVRPTYTRAILMNVINMHCRAGRRQHETSGNSSTIQVTHGKPCNSCRNIGVHRSDRLLSPWKRRRRKITSVSRVLVLRTSRHERAFGPGRVIPATAPHERRRPHGHRASRPPGSLERLVSQGSS